MIWRLYNNLVKKLDGLYAPSEKCPPSVRRTPHEQQFRLIRAKR